MKVTTRAHYKTKATTEVAFKEFSKCG